MSIDADISIKVMPDGASVRLEVNIEGKPFAEIPLAAKALDRLIHALGDARARLSDEFPAKPDFSTEVRLFQEPSLVAGFEERYGQKSLAILDPSFGWLQYTFSDDTAEKIAKAFLKNYQTPLK